jgi:tetratricopeptide (TPR) repeat protein
VQVNGKSPNQASPDVVSAEKSVSPFSTVCSRKTLLGLVLVAGTLWLYRPAEQYGFINFDDPDYVTANIPVQHGLAWKNLGWAFTTTAAGNWHPLTWLSHMLDYQVYGLNPAGHHLTSIFLHAVNVLLLFLILHAATGYLGRSFFVAAMFAAHPLNVQSVVWIAERKNLLSTFFLLLTLIAYGWYALRPSVRRYLVVASALAFGLMSKPMLVSVPFLLLLLDYWPLFRLKAADPAPAEDPGTLQLKLLPARKLPFRTLLLEKIPLLALCIASAVITYIAQGIPEHGVNAIIPWRYRPGNALYSYAWYLQKLVWPTKLAIYYPHPLNTLTKWQLIVAALVLLAETASALINIKKKPYAIVSWFWYLIALAPVIGIIQVGPQARADRYAYVPMIGILVTAVWAICEVTPKKFWRLLVLGWIACIIALGVDTRLQLPFWHDSAALFRHDLAVAPNNNYLAHASLANALMSENQCGEAIAHYHFVLQFLPQDGAIRDEYARCLLLTGEVQRGIVEEQRALKDVGESPFWRSRILEGLALAQMSAGQSGEAENNLRAAIAINPEASGAHLTLGMLLEKENRMPEAIDQLSQSVKILPSPYTYLQLGMALQRDGRYPEALQAYRSALKLAPGWNLAEQRVQALQRQSQETPP